MTQRKILVVHPYDKTTVFLDRVKNHIINSFKDDVHHFNIQPNDQSHAECLEKISKHPENGVIIFLGHGRSDTLYGSKGDKYETLFNDDPELKTSYEYYYNDNFINIETTGVFYGKKVFCLACNSNGKIAESAIENGAKTFLGFGPIPTSKVEFKDDGIIDVSNDLVRAMKTELNFTIKRSIEYSITHSFNFEQLKNILHFLINQRITEYLITKKKFKDRYLLADYLYQLKKGIIIYGDKKNKLID